MIQNIFDDPEFFLTYQKFRKKDLGFNTVLEKPTMKALLPKLEGKRVLDLGCGTGDLTRHIARRGASLVWGLDISKRMLTVARNQTEKFGDIVKLTETSIEKFQGPHQYFDCVVSSLALHYLPNLKQAFANIRAWLKPGGFLIFSVEHPIFMCGTGWTAQAGHRFWVLSDYFGPTKRSVNWLGKKVIKYHHTLENIVTFLTSSGFVVENLHTPRPTPKHLRVRPELASELTRPSFLLIKAAKK